MMIVRYFLISLMLIAPVQVFAQAGSPIVGSAITQQSTKTITDTIHRQTQDAQRKAAAERKKLENEKSDQTHMDKLTNQKNKFGEKSR